MVDYVHTLVNDYEKLTSYCEGAVFYVGDNVRPEAACYIYCVEYQISSDFEKIKIFEISTITNPTITYW